jgi:zinc transport system substrate-binding protein
MRYWANIIATITYILLGYAGYVGAAEKVLVYVSILPQKFFVQQIGRDLVAVRTMVQPGASPAMYEPKPKQMAELAKTKVYFAIGVPFEDAWLEKIAAANARMKIVHTDYGIKKLAMAAHRHDDEGDGEPHAKGEHHSAGTHGENRGRHTGLDPHIWLSPPLVRIQARAILVALQDIDPEHRSIYEANFHEFTAKLDRLDAELKKTFADRAGMQFMVFHPAWGYFAHAYGLKQVPIEIEGKDPKPAQLKALIQHARESGVRIIFVQPQFSTKKAALVAREIGGQVAFADPLAEQWMANLRAVADKFQAAMR